MAGQVVAAPALNESQIVAIGGVLSLYSGQNVTIHSTSDTVVTRLAKEIEAALSKAEIRSSISTEFARTYKGLSVVVHNANDVPPLAIALVKAFRAAGIVVNPAAASWVPAGEIQIYLGPN
jgi:hypothetical protein